ncbi:MAG: hypothetical protein J0J04_15760 [Microbacterium sp.]|uniref:hypothetical protein n=1 Tax=Microbacterium sp. TaxID=51671 RepID=UPI001AC0F4D5|nr:hypothetical protein [Microbacterium sp.]MBN9216231.1 hypothetical protein [Microbacterium sp.]
METIDLTPTPLEYANIAQRLIEGAYGLDAPTGLTNYQVLWAWQSAENTAKFIGAPLHELRRGLAEELLRHYIVRASNRPAIVITRETTYDSLNAEASRFPTCTTCGENDVEDAGDHAANTGHWPTSATIRTEDGQ